MSRTPMLVLLVCSSLIATIALLRASGVQQSTPYPGQPTQSSVRIQNHGTAEAVPVSVEGMAKDAQPLRVQLSGTLPAVTIRDGSVTARAVRQTWEYDVITVSSGQVPTTMLNAAGAEGWESAGIALPVQGGTVLVMKRPRQ
jgi:hypothetical protein